MRLVPRYRRIWAALILIVMGLALLAPTALLAQERTAEDVVKLRVDGPIVPVIGEYLDRGIGLAEEQGAVCVIELSTPGGLLDTTQKIVMRILNAEVPVVVYVSPAGGWAGSAGTFITIAADVAAMAPGSRIGAASPIAGDGAEMTEVQEAKITEDVAAWVRSIAEMRGRNVEKAELAVTESRSYTATEALELNLIDFRAENLDELLNNIDGMQVTLISGEVYNLQTAAATPVAEDMTTYEGLLQIISNPNIAYILLSIGMLGLLLEFYNPGSIFPGVAGGLALIIALYSLGTLDAHWGGVLLIIAGFAMFAFELFVASFGLLTAGGIIAILIGSLMLFAGSPTGIEVSWGVIAGVIVGILLFVGIAVPAIIKAHRRQATTGAEGMINQTGVAKSPLDPVGMVLFQGERWKAVAEDPPIQPEEEVVVIKSDGLKLFVRRKES